MKKFFAITLSAALFLSACSSTPEERIDSALEEVQEDAAQSNSDFADEHAGATPQAAMDAKYTSLFETYGALTYEAGYNADGSSSMGHSDYISKQLGLDYDTLVYIQIQSGTYGLQGMLDAMDSSAPDVAEAQEAIHTWHDVTDYDPAYFNKIMPDGLSDQEKVAFIVKTFADEYRTFYEGHGLGYIADPDALKEMIELTGLDEEDLTLVFKYGWIESVVGLFPASWEYTEKVKALVTKPL